MARCHISTSFGPADNTDPVRRVPMQWNYSLLLPSMALAGHVTHWGNRPMHFACSVAMSVRFGMDLGCTSCPQRTRQMLRAIEAYKKIRNVTELGVICIASKIRRRIRAEHSITPRRTNLARWFSFINWRTATPRPCDRKTAPNTSYTVHELNPAPGRAPIPQEGKTLTGAELMQAGVVPSCAKAVEACVIELSAKVN